MSYKETKPILSDTLKTVQSEVRQNFIDLNTAWQVNHSPINNELQGHIALTFPAQGVVPTTSATEGALFSRSSTLGSSNNAELCWKTLTTGAAFKINEFTSLGTGDEGWFQLPSGILFKYKFGHVINDALGPQSFTWNAAANYPAFTEIYFARVFISTDSGDSTKDVNAEAYVATPTILAVPFTVWRRNETNTLGTNRFPYRVNIFAIGKGPGV